MSDGSKQYHLKEADAVSFFRVIYHLRVYIEAQLAKCEVKHAP